MYLNIKGETMQDNKIMEELDRKYGKDEVFNKDITQQDDNVVKSLGDMGTLYKKITGKFEKDAICYMCKKSLNKASFDIIVVPDKKVEKGLVAFVSICKSCNSM